MGRHESSEQQIRSRAQAPVILTLRHSPHGPIINDVLGANAGTTPIAMWWAFLETENPILEGFYELNRADTLDKARRPPANSSPGPNMVWANAKGDIGWWAAAQLPIRPDGVNPSFILDGSTARPTRQAFTPSATTRRKKTRRAATSSRPTTSRVADRLEIPGYYNLADRGQQLDKQLSDTREVGPEQQPDAATGHHHRLRPTRAEAIVAGVARRR